MKRTKLPRPVVVEAYQIAKAALPPFSHRFSPRVYTQRQLFACLVLKDFYDLTYRAVITLLADCTSLAEAIGLESIPHFTTL